MLAITRQRCEACRGDGIEIRERTPEEKERWPKLANRKFRGDDPCPICRGSGTVYPAATVETIAEHLVEVIEHFNEVDVADIAVAVLDALNGETP